jgi:uncharacterized protein
MLRIEAAFCRNVITAAMLLLVSATCVAADTSQQLYDQLMRALINDRAEEVTALIARGADANAIDPVGDPALVVAARAGYDASLTALLKGGAKVDAVTRFGDSAIMIAALGGRASIVKKLIAAGSNVNRPGWTPLIYASTEGHDDVAVLLLDAGADVNAGAPNGTTALMMAARNGHEKTVDLLLARGADANRRNDTGATALFWADRAGLTQIATALKRAGATATSAGK